MKLLTADMLCKKIVDNSGYILPLFKNIDFSLEEGEFLTFLAPVGYGKTTLLKILASLDEATSGNIKYEDETKVVLIPSLPSSFPWLSVKENVEFAASNLSNTEINEIIKSVGLDGYEDHFPSNNSAGFRFRISLARAIAAKASIILIDDSFIHIDKKIKTDIYKMTLSVLKQKKITTVLSTTNISEALFFSDRIMLLNNKPAEIVNSFTVNYPEPRTEKTFTLPEFHTLHKDIETALENTGEEKVSTFII